MAFRFPLHEVSDLCLGKSALRSISITDTIADALSAVKRLDDSYLSVWSCHHSSLKAESIQQERGETGDCRCVGRVCMVDILYFLCKPENLSSLTTAIQSPVSVLIPKNAELVRHLEPNASLLEAIDVMLEGVQNLVIPIQSQSNTRKRPPSLDSTLHNNLSYCWVTQEDVIRFLLNSVGLFSPTAGNPINSLGVIDTNNLLAVHYDDPASYALNQIAESFIHQSSVAIIDPKGKLIGEISPFTLNSCDDGVSAAIATLSAGDLMAYIDCGGPPEELVQLVKERLEEQNLGVALELLGEESSGLTSWSSFSSTTSSDEEFNSVKSGKNVGYSARLVRRAEAIVCYPWSSLVAVMVQAIAHRVSYVWVVEEDGTLTGVVTFAGILKVFREHLKSVS